MSFVNVFLVKDDSLFFVRVHYRKVRNVLRDPKAFLKKLKPVYLDAGYVVIDLNRNVIVDGQLACFLREKKNFTVFR